MKRPLHPALARRLLPFEALNPNFNTRNVLSRSGAMLRCKLACSKGAGVVATEATLEPLFAMRAQMSPAVAWFATQPMQIKSLLPTGTGFKYTPDAIVELRDRCLAAVEVKPSARIARPEVAERLAAARAELARHGMPLLVATEVELRRDSENERVRYVRSFLAIVGWQSSEDLARRCMHLGRAPLRAYVEVLGSTASVFHLAARGVLFLDYAAPIDADAIVTSRAAEAAPLALFSGE
jgi:hypothetical protein